jgi:acyl-CoA reductase-like NAD-dependent aldehyde dehydrogenase
MATAQTASEQSQSNTAIPQFIKVSPFGGYKQSGIGRELGKHSIELYTQIKSVYVKLQ